MANPGHAGEAEKKERWVELHELYSTMIATREQNLEKLVRLREEEEEKPLRESVHSHRSCTPKTFETLYRRQCRGVNSRHLHCVLGDDECDAEAESPPENDTNGNKTDVPKASAESIERLSSKQHNNQSSTGGAGRPLTSNAASQDVSTPNGQYHGTDCDAFQRPQHIQRATRGLPAAERHAKVPRAQRWK